VPIVNQFGRLVLGVGVVLVLVGFAHWLLQTWASRMIQDLRDLPQLIWEIEEAKEHRRDLDAVAEDIFAGQAAKKRLIGELIAGRLSLLETAAGFKQVYKSRSSFVEEEYRRAWPGDSEEERYCRDVIAWVGVLANSPEQAREVTGRLEAELKERLHSGTLRFP
jgi:hypothetical protein